jgi:hypothetical protein
MPYTETHCQLNKLCLVEADQLVEFLPYPRMGLSIAVYHERSGCLGGLVGVAGIEGRRWVVFDSELDGFRDFWSGKFGDDTECEVDS